MADFTCRKEAGCGKTYSTPQARNLHELSHRRIERRPCPGCGKLVAEQFMPRHQRSHRKGGGRRIVKPKREPKPPAKRRSIGAILEELYEAVAFFEAEYDLLQKQNAEMQEQMRTAQKAFEIATAPRVAKPPRR